MSDLEKYLAEQNSKKWDDILNMSKNSRAESYNL
jgi:hypothetical protein